MKSATVTWITYNNYGTELQAYALQQYLLKSGVENVIISDRYIIMRETVDRSENLPLATEEKRKSKLIYYASHPGKIFYRVYYMMQCFRSEKIRKPYAASQRLFEEFKTNELNILYGLTREDMSRLNGTYDVFFCGSDQIWSVLDHNFDGYFYLDFVTGKKVAYAPSIGTENISKEKQAVMMEYLKSFSALSVRERQSAAQLSQWLDREVDWVLDPTLLQDTSFWMEFSKDVKTRKKKYLLCYFLENTQWYFKYAAQLAEYLGLQLLLIPSRLEYVDHKAVYPHGVGPKEFVALFRDAEFVLTDSYHGSIFAIQFEKNFLHFKRFADDAKNCQNIRVYSLFSALHLEKLILSEKDFVREDIALIPYQDIKQLISEHRTRSRKYIDQSIWESR